MGTKEENRQQRYERERELSDAARIVRAAFTSKFVNWNNLTDELLIQETLRATATLAAAKLILGAAKDEIADGGLLYPFSYESKGDDLRWQADQVESTCGIRLKGLVRERKRRDLRKKKKLWTQQAKEERAASIKKLPIFIIECFWCEGTGVRQDEAAELTHDCAHCAAVGHFLMNEPPKAKTIMDAVYEQDEDGIFRVVEDPAMARDRRLNKPTRRRFLTSKEAGAKLQIFPLGKRPAKKREIHLDDHSE